MFDVEDLINIIWHNKPKKEMMMILATCEQNYRAQTFVSDTIDE